MCFIFVLFSSYTYLIKSNYIYVYIYIYIYIYIYSEDFLLLQNAYLRSKTKAKA